MLIYHVTLNNNSAQWAIIIPVFTTEEMDTEYDKMFYPKMHN